MKTLIAILMTTAITTFADGAGPQYFPVSTNRHPVNAVSPFCSQWYSKHLNRMQEPSLFEVTNCTDIAAYRFTYLPTWGRPLAIRTVVTTNQLYVRKVVLSGDGGYSPGRIGLTQESISTNTLPPQFSDLIDKTVWNPEFTPKMIDGLDGSEWILEGIRNGQYRLIALWCPDLCTNDPQNKIFVDLCEHMVALSGQKMDQVMRDCHTVNLERDPLMNLPIPRTR